MTTSPRAEDLRVLHLFANYKWTGPADPAIRAAARLRALGIDVRFAQASFVHTGGEHRVAEELMRWRLPVVTGLELRKHFHVSSLRRDIRALRDLIARDRYDVLHCHQPADHLTAAIACRRLKRPPILVRTLYDPEAPRRGWRERAAFRRTQATLAPTAAAQEGVRRRFRVDRDLVLLQEPVTEPRQLDGPDARERFGLQKEHLVVGITARVQPHRRFELLWQVVRRLADVLPNVRLVLLGRGNDEDMQALVHQPIEQMGIGKHVVLPGYQKGPAYEEALRALDAFLFLVPGSDGTCRAVTDAMAFGVPVVSTSRGILPELLSERRRGEIPGYAVQEDADSLAAALLRLLQDEGLRARASRAALQRTRLDMDPQRAAERTRDLYLSLLRR
ncbi:MAG: glycosyltransferase family 4 protein [Planctomycetota bacterium]